MSIELCVLGSGSAGNSSVVRINGEVVLIDAGFGPRSTAKRLADTGVSVRDIRAILLTHLDSDHFNPNWYATLLEHEICVYCPRRHIKDLYEGIRRYREDAEPRVLHERGLIQTIGDDVFELPFAGLGVRVKPIHLTHDREGTVGFIVNSGAHRLGFATDLGHVPGRLVEAMCGVDLLAIESNYDAEMEAASDRPMMLKRRVMSDHGHLSNDQALNAVREVFDRSELPPRHVVLLHLSRQCNDPVLVRDLYADHPAISDRLCVTNQSHRTDWLSADGRHHTLPGEQMGIFVETDRMDDQPSSV